jgi:hypothetical protein
MGQGGEIRRPQAGLTQSLTFHNRPFREMVGIRLRGRLDRNDEAVFLQRMSPVRHFAAFAALQFFGSYRTNNGHHRTLVRRRSVAIDPKMG